MKISKFDSSEKKQKIYELEGLMYMRLPITKMVKGGKILWSLITSCFGSGTWIKTSSWINSEIWKNK